MPLYVFQNLDGEYQDMFFTMSEAPRLGQEIEVDGVKWKRVFTSPNASTNSTTTDPYSSADFERKLAGKNMTIGNWWDASREASEKRAAKDGVDPVKQKFYDQYAESHHGVRHKAEKSEQLEVTKTEIAKELKKALNE